MVSIKLYTALVALCALLVWVNRANAEPYSGLFCKNEKAMIEVMTAYKDGGFTLEDSVASALVEKGECMRIPEDNPIDLVVVMEGQVIGQHKLYGFARSEQGDIELYGQSNYNDHFI